MGIPKNAVKAHTQYRKFAYAFAFLALLAGLYALSRYSYLVFHSFIEIFGVIVSGCVFILSRFSDDKKGGAFSVLGLGYLFVGMVDLLHTLSYQGMNVFDSDAFYANQLWVCARFLESVTILLFLSLIRKKPVGFGLAVTLYSSVFAFFVATIFVFPVFPACFIPGIGQTPFKIIAEYAICAVLAACAVMANRNNRIEDTEIRQYLTASIVITILSEICFTLYTDNYGVLNVIGHQFKLVSLYFVYKSVLLVNVKRPLGIIFRQLSEKEEKILALMADLEGERNAAVSASIRDALTGIYNRGYFNEILPKVIGGAKREGHPLSLIMIDIDYFKRYNDYYGHILGDDCLRKVVRALKGTLKRPDDILARYGGEEFVAILEGTDAEGAEIIAEEMRAAVYDSRIEHAKSDCSGFVTVSLGMVTFGEKFPDTPEGAVDFADKALYRAKEGGRNRAYRWSATDGPVERPDFS